MNNNKNKKIGLLHNILIMQNKKFDISEIFEYFQQSIKYIITEISHFYFFFLKNISVIFYHK